MFKKKLDPGTTDTLIGEGSTFEGKIKSQASIRLEGEITGDVVCEGDVIIGERGVARSNVSARNVVLAGTVHGNVIAKGKLIVKSSGRLLGNLSASELAIEAGGFFHGTSQMENKDAPQPQDENRAAAATESADDSADRQKFREPETPGTAASESFPALNNIPADSVLKSW
ncbi:bactofilin family protein [Cohnella zeiphila]|uniref:Polymer-forming cytoskeletal protein n=1 Tax=Cohnella zeiphila TaxID=2761120 RepID=A0A7X0STU3_9BACL|nr:polymer-forming cytoskeletal protein [Cohnella zeiphila]MBB6735014.1 polymer-forming cytoskeletal protein [Cohnella zeiphila]